MVKNDHRNISEASWPCLFFFFLLLLTNFTKNLSISSAKPLTSAPSLLFIGNEGVEVAQQLAQASWLLQP